MQWLALQHIWSLAIIPAIIILYLLKRKYTEVEVSSILLWQQVLREQEANRPWQKLRYHLLLFLQLVVASLLILALLRPALAVEGVNAPHTVLVLDSSGSMLAVQGEETRFALAKQRMEELISNLGSKQSITLIEVGQEPKLWLAQSKEQQALQDALAQIVVRVGSGNQQAALSLATAIAQSEPGTGIMWFGDGAGASAWDKASFSGLDPALFEQIQLGESKENVAISAFVTQIRGAEVEGLIRLDNYGLRQREGQLKIYNDQEQLLEKVDVVIQGGRSFALTLVNLPTSTFYLAQLDLEGDGLVEDNQLWSVPFSQSEIRAVLVSREGNRFLSHALTLGNRVHLEKMNELPDTLAEDVDVWIFDGLVPEELPAGNMLLIGPKQATAWLPYQGQSEVVSAEAERREGEHPLLEHIDWVDLYVAEVAQVSHLPELQSLVSVGKESLLLAGEIEGRKTAVLSFDLHDSDFPLRTAFPIFIQNSLSWLAPLQSVPIGTGYPGERLVLPLTPGATERTVYQPDGTRVELEPTAATTYLYQVPEQLGLYKLEEVRSEERMVRYFSVQMPESESNLEDQKLSEVLSTAGLVGQQTGQEQEEELEEARGLEQGVTEHSTKLQEAVSSNDGSARGSKELSMWLAALALFFVALEWVVYQRGY